MLATIECIPCILNQAIRVSYVGTDNHLIRERIVREILGKLQKEDWKITPMQLAYKCFKHAKTILNRNDPYAKIKKEHNKIAKSYLNKIFNLMKESKKPLRIATNSAIAGNIIDFGPSISFEIDKIIHEIHKLSFAIDHFNIFEKKINTAKTIAYLLDNAGEVIFDIPLLRFLKENNKEVTIFARSEPVANDVTVNDAIELGLDRFGKIRGMKLLPNSNGKGIYVGNLEKTLRNFDLVISKGQGNFELFDEADADIFFLLRIKCVPIAKRLKSEVGKVILGYSRQLFLS